MARCPTRREKCCTCQYCSHLPTLLCPAGALQIQVSATEKTELDLGAVPGSRPACHWCAHHEAQEAELTRLGQWRCDQNRRKRHKRHQTGSNCGAKQHQYLPGQASSVLAEHQGGVRVQVLAAQQCPAPALGRWTLWAELSRAFLSESQSSFSSTEAPQSSTVPHSEHDDPFKESELGEAA